MDVGLVGQEIIEDCILSIPSVSYLEYLLHVRYCMGHRDEEDMSSAHWEVIVLEAAFSSQAYINFKQQKHNSS